MIAVIATHNSHKAREMSEILGPALLNFEFLSLASFPDSIEPEETGATYAENAIIKAMSAFNATGLMSLADDAGLEIDALDGAPGLWSKRFGGEDLPFPEKMSQILGLMENVPWEQRRARFRCCVAVVSNLETKVFEATCEGSIGLEGKGAGGFGYDPIFYPDDANSSMAELSATQKHAISHRGKVLAMVQDYLRQIVLLPAAQGPFVKKAVDDES